MKCLVIIPTLNENKNISILINKILSLSLKLTVLIIDDNSIDGTRDKILFLNKKYKSIKYIFRPRRLGLGSAHKQGFKYALKKKFDLCITIDADLTHDPINIKKMLKIVSTNKFSIINTSRFMENNSLKDWPLLRIVITKIRYYLVSFLLGTKMDSSGGFRCYNLKKINKNDLFLSKNNSYFFLIESLFYFEKKKYLIKEIPIILPYRLYGSSKMKITDIFFSLLDLLDLKLKKIRS